MPEVLMNCDICDNDFPESTLISIGEVSYKGEQELEVFTCEGCAEKVSKAFSKRKEARKRNHEKD